MPTNARTIGFVVAIGLALVLAVLAPQLWANGGVERLPEVVPRPAAAPGVAAPSADVPRLFQTPALSRTQIAFALGGELWIVARDGGGARRLVSGQLGNGRPVFSPDGALVAFAGTFDGNTDVYVVPAAGGESRRLTFHPDSDVPLAFTPDGERILFRSMRATPRDLPKLFSVSVKGGYPEALPLPSGSAASYAPDGQRLAYVPIVQWQPEWRSYRGGQTTPIWIASLADSTITKVPREGSNDRSPMWIDDQVYFLSDRNGPYTLFAYDTKSGQVRQLIDNADGPDLRSASAGPGAIVFEQLGRLSLYELAGGTVRGVPIQLAADLPQVRPHAEKIDPGQVLHVAVSPTGQRVLLEARGEQTPARRWSPVQTS